MKLHAVLASLARAEEKLGISLVLTLQVDGSGAVDGGIMAETRVFKFESLADLTLWLHSPRIVVYDEYGDARG